MLLLDFMAVAVALPAVHHSLNASFAELEWVLEAFLLTLAALILTAGRITDIVGRRSVFLGGLIVFGVGSLLGGLAQTPVLPDRRPSGAGHRRGIALCDRSRTAERDLPRGEGRAAVAVWGTVTGVAIASSPLVGGEIASTLGWRWLFLLEVPVSVLALLIGLVAIKDPSPDQTDATLPRAPGAPKGRPRPSARTGVCGWSTGGASPCSSGPSPSS